VGNLEYEGQSFCRDWDLIIHKMLQYVGQRSKINVINVLPARDDHFEHSFLIRL